MKIPYREYVSVLPGSSDFRLILRPIVTVRISGLTGHARWDALVDTGADETIFPLSMAELIGIKLDEEVTSVAAGISGDRLKIHYGEVGLEIEADGTRVAWRTTVGFVDFGRADDEVIILGHGGCLDYFTATFDGENSLLELMPNSLLPSSFQS